MPSTAAYARSQIGDMWSNRLKERRQRLADFAATLDVDWEIRPSSTLLKRDVLVITDSIGLTSEQWLSVAAKVDKVVKAAQSNRSLGRLDTSRFAIEATLPNKGPHGDPTVFPPGVFANQVKKAFASEAPTSTFASGAPTPRASDSKPRKIETIPPRLQPQKDQDPARRVA